MTGGDVLVIAAAIEHQMAARGDLAGGLKLLRKIIRIRPPLTARREPQFVKLARRMAVEGERLNIGVLMIEEM